MTGTQRIKQDIRKYMIAIVMLVVLCSLAIAGRAQIAALQESGQIAVESEEPSGDDAANNETAEKLPSPPSQKVNPAE